MESVFIYWDNSNIFIEAQRLAEEREDEPDARYRVRVFFDNMLRLAQADRPLERAYAAGSVPPEMRQLWNRMEGMGVKVELFDRGIPGREEQEIPDRLVQLRMLEDALDYNGDPGIVVLLTGDGAGYLEGGGLPQYPGAHAQAGLAHRDTILGALLQPAHAQVGGGERHIRAAGQLLRVHHIHGTFQAGVPAGSWTQRRSAGPVTAGCVPAALHRLTLPPIQ